MDKLLGLLNAVGVNKEVDNSAAYKQMQIKGSALVMIVAGVVMLAKSMGYDLHITEEQIQQAGAALVMVFAGSNALVTAATSKKVGLLGGVAKAS